MTDARRVPAVLSLCLLVVANGCVSKQFLENGLRPALQAQQRESIAATMSIPNPRGATTRITDDGKTAHLNETHSARRPDSANRDQLVADARAAGAGADDEVVEAWVLEPFDQPADAPAVLSAVVVFRGDEEPYALVRDPASRWEKRPVVALEELRPSAVGTVLVAVGLFPILALAATCDVVAGATVVGLFVGAAWLSAGAPGLLWAVKGGKGHHSKH